MHIKICQLFLADISMQNKNMLAFSKQWHNSLILCYIDFFTFVFSAELDYVSLIVYESHIYYEGLEASKQNKTLIII